MQISVEAVVEAPPQAVFALMADVAAWPKVIPAIKTVEILTPGPVAVGTRFRETRRMFGQWATEEIAVAEIVSPHRFVLTAFNHGTAYRTEHLFEPEGSGTRAMLVFEGRPVSLAARLFTPLAGLFVGSVRRHLAADLAALKVAAERRQNGI
jgi:hypothetical protein